MDRLQRFIDEECDLFIEGKMGQIKADNLWNAFQIWCNQVGESPENQKRFGERMREKGIKKKRKSDGMYYQGNLM